MARVATLLLALGSAHGAIELTPDNFDKEVFDSGKSAFIKFLAPWFVACSAHVTHDRPRVRSRLGLTPVHAQRARVATR